MKNKVVFFLVGLLICGMVGASWTAAEECDNIGNLSYEQAGICIGKFQGISEAIAKANTTNANDLKNLQAQVVRLQGQIGSMEKQLEKLSGEIFDREVKIGVKQELLSAKVRQDYIRKTDQSMLLMLFSAKTAADFFKDISFREKLARQDREVIATVSREVKELNEKTDKIRQQKESLAGLKIKVDAQAKWLAGEVEKASKYVADLGGKIAALTARQQEILSAKTGTFQTSVGDVPLADDYNASIEGFRNAAPGGSFAVFSFGAPHFNGMSQYGAYGRAKAGQGTEEILKAYYGGGVEIKKDYSTAINITVQGYGTVDIETYVKRIYEMPSSWTDNGSAALKAQAVAARSYALAHTNNGSGSICATEACQVYKPANKGGAWDAAVEATRGWVLMVNGKPFSAKYASTSGGYLDAYTANGYTTPGFWDTPSGRSGWTSQAYEQKAGSPWFYKAWYKSRSGDSCGRGNPWLSGEEMADILNAWKVLFEGGGDASRVTPTGSCWGGNPYNKDELRALGGFNNVTGVNVTYSDGGVTANVTFQTNSGSKTIGGLDFKKAFNLRAPGQVSLKSGLFNIEKK